MPDFAIVQCEQRSEQWRQARCGRATGSRAADVVARLKSGGEAAARRDYRLQLVCERLTGRPQESDYVNDEMRRGIELEPAALGAYEALTGRLAVTTGFLVHGELQAGCSLDAHLDDFRVLVSLKAPKSATHLRYLRGGEFPAEHEPQMLHELLLVPQAEEYDFLSFDDRFPESMQVFYVRVPRWQVQQAVTEYEQALRKFLSEVDVDLAAVRTMADTAAVLRESVAS